ncbi:hypothetical protein [uncultured Gammaproteobacteria bacterium]|nr:hypothetical protein [uncultured Gammaproteobacteria bacterium]
MAFLGQNQIDEVRGKLTNDVVRLASLYRAKRKDRHEVSVRSSLVEQYERQGWEVSEVLKTKTKLIKEKKHSEKFEDQIWCQFYSLGFRYMNKDETLVLPWGKEDSDKKQIDVVAIDKGRKIVFLIECKSSEKPRNAPSYKDEFDLLKLRIDGFRKSMSQLLGDGFKIQHVFATRNQKLSESNEDYKRLIKANSIHYNDNTYEYVNNLVNNYKDAAIYQFLGFIFRGQKIDKNKLSFPAIQGTMGGLTYYIFAVEPKYLLQIGFVLHRMRANENDFPTYQRLLVPNRLKNLRKFLEEDKGYFPNSIIINFDTKNKHNLIEFQQGTKGSSHSISKLGILKIPNAYGLAYIIDGQHRVYGFSGLSSENNSTIPVVAFDGLPTEDQLKIFMDINQNQKPVKAALVLDMKEDLLWDSDSATERMQALSSAIVKKLSNNSNSCLYRIISVGEDKAKLDFKPFYTAILKSSLLPPTKGKNFVTGNGDNFLLDTGKQDRSSEMKKVSKDISTLIERSYLYIEENFADLFNSEDNNIIFANKGTYALIVLIGSLNKFLYKKGDINSDTPIEGRIDLLQQYLNILCRGISDMKIEEIVKLNATHGGSGDIIRLRYFQNIINKTFADYNPLELIDWKERQDKKLQMAGRELVDKIEKHMKSKIISGLQARYGERWGYYVSGGIRKNCIMRMEDTKEKEFSIDKEVREYSWTEFFEINDYKKIILKEWSQKPKDLKSMEQLFSVFSESGNNKVTKTKWIDRFSKIRNLVSHSGSKEKGINKKEVEFLQETHGCLLNNE